VAARHDQVTDPQITEALLLARRGTAYFSRHLAQLTADDLYGPSLLSGWSRAHVVAHVAYHARHLAHLLEKIRTSEPVPTGEETYDVDYAATLPQAALQNLHAHTVVHLNVEWRDLPADKWETVVQGPHGSPLRLVDTLWNRAKEVWMHAVDLNTGGKLEDVPSLFLDQLSEETLSVRDKAAHTQAECSSCACSKR
jgi:maleylpyruvate isomerase